MLKKTILSIILIILLAAGANAYEENFQASSPYQTLNVCQCQTITNPISVKNTNMPQEQIVIVMNKGQDTTKRQRETVQSESVYHITQEGSSSKYSSIYPNTFILGQDETKELFSEITASCSVKGQFDLITRIKTDLGLEKIIKQKINIKECNNIGLTILNKEGTGCPCETIKFDILLENTGSFEETYSIGISDNLRKYFSLSENPVTLKSGQSKKITAFFNGPCEMYGSYKFDLSVEAQNSGQISKDKLELDLKRCYDFDVQTGKLIHSYQKNKSFESYLDGYEICEKEKDILLPIKIINKAKIPNTYRIELGSEDWAELDYNKIPELKEGEESTINIVMNPYAYLEYEGDFVLKVITEKGDIEKEYKIPINVDRCYTPKISEELDKINVNYSVLATELSIENIGSLNSSFNTTINLDWAEIRPQHLKIGPSESKIVNLITFPGNETKEGKYEATLSVISNENNVEYQKEITINLKSEKEHQGIKLLSIFALILLVLIIVVVALWITNKKGKDEEVKYSNKKTTKIIKREDVLVSETQKTKKINWGKLIAIIIIFLIILGALFMANYYTTSESSKSNITNESTINQTDIISKETSQAGMNTSMNESKEVQESGFNQRTKDMIDPIFNFVKLYLLYILVGIILAIILIIFLSSQSKDSVKERKSEKRTEEIIEVKARTKPASKTKKAKKSKRITRKEKKSGGKIFGFILLLLIIIAIAALVWINNPDNKENDTQEYNFSGVECVKNWSKNSEETIELGDIFKDPEGDVMTFYSNNPANMNISIRNSQAILKPKKDFVGVIKAEFGAIDSDGNNVSTGNMSFCITNQDTSLHNKIWNKLVEYKYWSILAAIIVLFVILIAIFHRPIMNFLEEEEEQASNIKHKKKK